MHSRSPSYHQVYVRDSVLGLLMDAYRVGRRLRKGRMPELNKVS